jgi:adenylate cyclase
VETLNVTLAAEGLPRIAIGIGLSSGPMTIGNMGSDDHFSYTALGDRVNLGARLEGQTKEYGVSILVSEACHALVKDELLCRELGSLRVKGKNEPVRVYELIATLEESSPAQRELKARFEAALALFRARRFDEARAAFAIAAELIAGQTDRASELYVGWCEEYEREPPPADWDGVRVATSK